MYLYLLFIIMRNKKDIWYDYNISRLKLLIHIYNSRPQFDYLTLYIKKKNWLPVIESKSMLWYEYKNCKSFQEAINYLEDTIIEMEETRQWLREIHKA